MWLAALILCAIPSAEEVPQPCDVLIVGGSLGGCAAAIGAAGLDVWMVEDSDWIGGQVTSQGVSALDEHRLIESFGGTREYMQFRAGVRRRSGGVANPGGGWVSRLCFEPRVGLAELEERLARCGTKILRESRVVEARVSEDRVRAVRIVDRAGAERWLAPKLVLEASDTGEFYPLAGIEHRLGSDAREETRETHAKDVADPARQQSYTYPFAVEWRPGESHVIAKPEGYERFRDSQPYTLDIMSASGKTASFGFFEKRAGLGAFWNYRRIAPTIAMINWPGNDYRGAPLIGGDTRDAKLLSLGFLYWLQTECPRDDGGKGYPELLLRKDIMGTGDGLSKRPYVREPRRLAARTIVYEEDLLPQTARARLFHDSVGLGWYPIDVHACSNERKDSGGLGIPTKPFQVPLGSMLPVRVRNVVAAGKAIGVSHITNGAYRLHPIEWSVGEAAGELARFALARGVEPGEVRERAALLEAFQRELLERGLPVFWFSDLKDGSEEWKAAQWLAVRGELVFAADKLELGLDAAQREQLVQRWRAARR